MRNRNMRTWAIWAQWTHFLFQETSLRRTEFWDMLHFLFGNTRSLHCGHKRMDISQLLPRSPQFLPWVQIQWTRNIFRSIMVKFLLSLNWQAQCLTWHFSFSSFFQGAMCTTIRNGIPHTLVVMSYCFLLSSQKRFSIFHWETRYFHPHNCCSYCVWTTQTTLFGTNNHVMFKSI